MYAARMSDNPFEDKEDDEAQQAQLEWDALHARVAELVTERDHLLVETRRLDAALDALGKSYDSLLDSSIVFG